MTTAIESAAKADPASEPSAPTQPTPPKTPEAPSAALFAGKYPTPDALEKATREILPKMPGFEDLQTKPLLGKDGIFSDIAAMEKFYVGAEKTIGRLGQLKGEQPEPKSEGGGPRIPDQPADDGPADIPTFLEKAGLKLDDVAKQWTEHGTLTDEQYAALRKVRPGLTKADINHIAEGQAAKAALHDQFRQKAWDESAKLAGGEDAFKELLNWAAKGIPKDRVTDLNRRLDDQKLFLGAVRELVAEHREAVGAGKAQPLIHGADAGQSGGAFTSYAEMKRFKAEHGENSAAFRARVAKTPISTIAAWQNG